MRRSCVVLVLIVAASLATGGGGLPSEPPAPASTPPLLSRRAQALAPSSFDLTVGRAGALMLDIDGVVFEVTSSFSEVGPHWNNLTLTAGGGNGWAGGAPAVDASGAAQGRWVVTATAANFTLTRVVLLDPPPPKARTDKLVSVRRLLINDTIVNSAPATIGVAIRHNAALVKGGAVDGVTVPGVLSPGMCGTDDNPGNFCGPGTCDRDAHRLNGASPHIFLNATSTGASAAATDVSLGLVALDDVFRVHAEARNFAVKQLNPRVQSNCVVSSPPSIRLSDPILALAAGTSQTHEWAIYPSSNCTSFFCFVNVLRNDYGTDKMVLGKHRGVLSAMEHGADAQYSDMSEWARSGYVSPACNNSLPPPYRVSVCENWTDWTTPNILKYMTRQGVNVMPIANGIDRGGDLPCGGHLELNGAMFVNGENPPTSRCGDCYAQHEALIRKVVKTAARVSTPERPIKTSYYIDTSISTGAYDWNTYADARVLDVHGKQVLYRPCSGADVKYANLTAARQGELPMFFGTVSNSYGPIIRRYIDKIFALGVNGVYHDEYGYSLVAFTYGTWDNHSAFLNPEDLSIRALVGSLDLLSLELELEIQTIIAANDGFFMANGPPVTRTIIEGQFGVHFQEDAEHCRVKHVQTYTPVMLNRDGVSQAGDADPKYSRKGNFSGADVCWNIVNHLDDGVLSENYDGMIPKLPDLPTIWEHMYPITAIELGDGFVIGRERVVTKASGVFIAPPGTSGHKLFLYEQCLLVGTATAKHGIDGGSAVMSVEDEKVTVVLKPEQQAVIVWGS
jgi:hypothetical protein